MAEKSTPLQVVEFEHALTFKPIEIEFDGTILSRSDTQLMNVVKNATQLALLSLTMDNPDELITMTDFRQREIRNTTTINNAVRTVNGVLRPRLAYEPLEVFESDSDLGNSFSVVLHTIYPMSPTLQPNSKKAPSVDEKALEWSERVKHHTDMRAVLSQLNEFDTSVLYQIINLSGAAGIGIADIQQRIRSIALVGEPDERMVSKSLERILRAIEPHVTLRKKFKTTSLSAERPIDRHRIYWR